MMIIDTVKVNDKNTRTVNTKDGDKLVMSYGIYPLGVYVGGIWLPKNVQFGDVVDICISQIEKDEKDDKTYYNAKFPKANKNFLLSPKDREPQGDLFGGTPMEVSEDDLPF